MEFLASLFVGKTAAHPRDGLGV